MVIIIIGQHAIHGGRLRSIGDAPRDSARGMLKNRLANLT